MIHTITDPAFTSKINEYSDVLWLKTIQGGQYCRAKISALTTFPIAAHSRKVVIWDGFFLKKASLNLAILSKSISRLVK